MTPYEQDLPGALEVPLSATIGATLEATIDALSRFDLERLLTLEERVTRLLHSETTVVITPALLERRDRLGRTLEQTQTNLGVLTRLRSRKEDGRWEL